MNLWKRAQMFITPNKVIIKNVFMVYLAIFHKS